MHELPCLGFCGILCKAKDAGWPPSALPETLCASGPGRPGRRRTSSPGAHLPPGNCTSEVMSRAPLTFLFSPFHLFLFLFVFSLSPLSPLCSRDAAKRKAWKLNRVGSLRNIYSSSTNTEGNAAPPPSAPLTLAFPPSRLPCLPCLPFPPPSLLPSSLPSAKTCQSTGSVLGQVPSEQLFCMVLIQFAVDRQLKSHIIISLKSKTH